MILEQKGYQNREIIENLESVFMVSKTCKKQKGKKEKYCFSKSSTWQYWMQVVFLHKITNVLSFDFSYYKGVFTFWEDKTNCRVLIHFLQQFLGV